MNPYATARQAYTQSSTLTASPEQLVVMLYDGAVRFLNQCAAAMHAGDRTLARDRMRRAEAIIDELNGSLDLSHGQLPVSLQSIYFFCKRHLVSANIDFDPAKVDAVSRLLSDLRDAWAQIAGERRLPDA